MSIQPPSDIVLDVAQAADPVKSMAATQRLMRIAGPDTASGDFSEVLENVSTPPNNAANLRTRLNFMGGSPGINQLGPADAQTKAYKGLEALIFQNLFETTLPHDESLGPGMAGDVWRSMLAEQLGKQTANMIDLGIFPKAGTAHGSQTGKGLMQRPVSKVPVALYGVEPAEPSS